MAGGSALVLLIDEIATMVKVTAQKTSSIATPARPPAGQTGDAASSYYKHDTGIILDVAKGSLRNKAFLVPAALALNFFIPWAVLPLVAAGGVYFSYEGIKKVQEHLHPHKTQPLTDADIGTLAEHRAKKIKAAIKTDMVLSTEIVAITLALVATMPLAAQAMIMSGVAIGATAAAYTVIAGIIKMEDLGGWLANKSGDQPLTRMARTLGRGILDAKPKVMNGISIAGSAAIFMVGGSLLFHGLPAFGHIINDVISSGVANPYLHSVVKLGAAFVTGIAMGTVATPVITAMSPPIKTAATSVAAAVRTLRSKIKTATTRKQAPATPVVTPPDAVAGKPALADQTLRAPFDKATQTADAPAPPQTPASTATPPRPRNT